MLVLARKKHESIVINGNIKVKIVDLGSNQVRIGIEAPPEIPILRAELHAKIQEEFCGNDTSPGVLEVAL